MLNLLSKIGAKNPQFVAKWKKIIPTLNDEQFNKAKATITARKEKLDKKLIELSQNHLKNLYDLKKSAGKILRKEEQKNEKNEETNESNILSKLNNI